MEPPHGYDDPSEISRKRLIQLISRFEDELHKVTQVFQEHVPVKLQLQHELETDFWSFRHSADELGPQFSNLVEDLIHNYEKFKNSPSQAQLGVLLQEVEHLKVLLTAV